MIIVVSLVSHPSLHILNRSSLFLRERRQYLYFPYYIWRATAKKISSETTMPIVAEYAKSNRSSCKSCSKTIAVKSLRLGLISKGPGGFDMTRWHHFDCFPTDSESIASVEDIQGLSALEKDDQDALAKLVEQCGEPAKEQLDEKEKEIKEPASNEISGKKIKETKGSSDSSKVIAEYAKSSRSSCKKCSQTIASKELRLGLVSRDPRGFGTTKWHHLGCFPVDSDPIDSVKDIGGYSSLQSGDQDALKELVQQCKKKTLKMDEDNDESETDNRLTEETNKRKHSQVGEMVEEDELQTNKNQQTTRKPKMNISESTSQVEVETEISLSASDVKVKYRDAGLLPKWKAFETVIFLERDAGLNDSEKIAAFDFDGCLAKTSVKIVGAEAWSLMYPSIPEKLQSLYSQGYKLVIFTNESNIDRWKNKRQAAVDSKIGRLNSFIKRVEVPIQVFIACGVASSGGKDDLYRKPKAGMWQLMKKHFNSGIVVDMDKSFYVGDAAGRKGDHSDADIKFAQASGLKFYTPEEYFISSE
ncbi:Polynucleotide 3'-phosphatase ZDP [Cardamine amara subsp. amara]|uniref:Polynucleotide 3'-phosphatase ZDP n=1 Tax=Cardamine amara subsp. amara TaxID=228776 RepID=A0ABD1A6I4_CARAN